MESPSESNNQSAAAAAREARRGDGMLNAGHFGVARTGENTAESFERSSYPELGFDEIDAELREIDDVTPAGARRMFVLAATAIQAIARNITEKNPTPGINRQAASVILEDINDDDGSPFFVVVAVKDASGENLWEIGDDDETGDAFAEYVLLLDRDLSKLETVDRNQGLSKLTF